MGQFNKLLDATYHPPRKWVLNSSLSYDCDELTEEEAFDLYYEEHRRVQEEKNSMSYDELLRKSGVKPPEKN